MGLLLSCIRTSATSFGFVIRSFLDLVLRWIACVIIGILLCGRHPSIASELETERSAHGVTSVGAEVMICRPSDKNLVLLASRLVSLWHVFRCKERIF